MASGEYVTGGDAWFMQGVVILLGIPGKKESVRWLGGDR